VAVGGGARAARAVARAAVAGRAVARAAVAPMAVARAAVAGGWGASRAGGVREVAMVAAMVADLAVERVEEVTVVEVMAAGVIVCRIASVFCSPEASQLRPRPKPQPRPRPRPYLPQQQRSVLQQAS
jgi:hypothetical protein